MTRPVRVAMALLLGILLAGAWASPARAGVSFDFFYSNLRPYGAWRVSAQYGRVWRPYDETRGWNPYYDGHWVYADVGWTWVSDYDWGGIPYHYGTWVEDPVVGWAWVPGYTWAPAWVVFRTGPDYIGWAPVEPGFTVGVSAGFGARAAGPFIFVSSRNFLAPRVRTCVVPESRARVILRGTRVEGGFGVERNVVINRGPDVRMVERASGRSVRSVPIERVSGLGPRRYVSRGEIAVSPRGGERDLRAASPVPASRPWSDRVAREGRAAPRDVRSGVEPRRVEPRRMESQRVEPQRIDTARPRSAPGAIRQPQPRGGQDPRGERGRPPRHQDHGHGHP